MIFLIGQTNAYLELLRRIHFDQLYTPVFSSMFLPFFQTGKLIFIHIFTPLSYITLTFFTLLGFAD